jgi:hypothetical protein
MTTAGKDKRAKKSRQPKPSEPAQPVLVSRPLLLVVVKCIADAADLGQQEPGPGFVELEAAESGMFVWAAIHRHTAQEIESTQTPEDAELYVIPRYFLYACISLSSQQKEACRKALWAKRPR